ncbi:MAG: AsnC family transcriptional regulator [Candidatus Micrarchaeota archaeon]|nr:AsnC family transcriptional regulator [Candidatus Micrarchaeota archaeon]MDE1834587.1 AsnC family transcriptional regulator [Candidatus Micrarchaeota archaeon]MDE1859616.1 AsnC family transcriptional regulator [Candidatus Micrarchaeota archaeon]
MSEHGQIKKALLRELSENSRISITDLAKKLKCSRNAAIDNIKLLEQEFGLKYTLQFGDDPYVPIRNQIITVKFRVKPKDSVIRAMFKNSKYVSFVAITEGDFDLLIHMVTDSVGEYTRWAFLTFSKLYDYGPLARPSIIDFVHMGFMPIPDADLSESKMKQFGTIDDLDKKLLLLLNNESKLSDSALSKKAGENVDTVRKRTKRLLRSEIIKKYTAILSKPPAYQYNIAFFINYRFCPDIADSYTKLKGYYTELDEKSQLINPFQYIATTNGSYSLFGIGCFRDEETAITGAVLAHKEIFKAADVEISYAKIREVVYGNLPIRNIDIRKEFRPIAVGSAK